MPNGESRVTAITFSNDCQKLFAAREGVTYIDVFQLPDLAHDFSLDQPCGTPMRLAIGWSGNFLMVTLAQMMWRS